MPLKTFTIEIRADYADEGKHDILKSAAFDAARMLLTTAMMMQEKRPPMVALQSSDFFYGNEDLSIDDEERK